MAHLASCLTYKYVAVDMEGYAPNILGISIATPVLDSMYFPIGHKETCNVDAETNEFIQHVLTTVPYRIMHNAGHDIIAIPYIADLPFVCTMILGHMVDENIMSKSLDFMSKWYCGNEGKEMDPLMDSIIKTMGWEYVPYSLMYNYALVDARITMELFQKLLPLYEEQFGPLWT